MAPWKIGLALFLVAAFASLIGLAIWAGARSFRVTSELVRGDVEKLLAPQLSSGAFRMTSDAEAEGRVNDREVRLQFRSPGAAGSSLRPWKGVRLWLVRVRLPAGTRAADGRRLAAQEIVAAHGGRVDVADGWLDWTGPTADPSGEQLRVILERLAEIP